MFALQSSDAALFIWCHCRGGVFLLLAFVVMFAYRFCLFVVVFVRPHASLSNASAQCILVKCIGSALVFLFSPPRLVSVRS